MPKEKISPTLPPYPHIKKTSGTSINIPQTHKFNLTNGKEVLARPDKTKKRNPVSLRFIFAIIMDFFYEGKSTKTHDEMKLFAGRYSGPKKNDGNIDDFEDQIPKYLYDTQPMRYLDVEAISRSIGFPTGATLILSRLYSTIYNYPGQKKLTAEYLKSMRCFLDELEKIQETETISPENFEAFQHCFIKFNKMEYEAAKNKEEEVDSNIAQP